MDAIRALLKGPEPVRWVFAGDSITHGAAHTVGWRDYTELFSERVRWELGRGRDIVIKTGISGWTVADLAADLDWNVLQFRPDCVSLMFGLNDCLGGDAGVARFEADYLDVIAKIRDRTGAAVLVQTPNWMLPTDRAARLEALPAYREAVLRVAEAAGAPCLDHYPIWRAAEPSGSMHHWLAHGCHPNEYGHRVLAHTLFRALNIWDAETSWACRLNVPSYEEIGAPEAARDREDSMQFVTFIAPNGETRAGVHRDGAIVDLGPGGNGAPTSVLGLLEAGPAGLEQARALSNRAGAPSYPIADVRLLAPIPRPPKVLGLAGNFVAHIIEGGGRPRPKEGAVPDVFIMPASAVIGTGAEIEIPVVSNFVDYELELAAVIGKPAKRVAVAEAMDYVAGYAIFNDVSARRMTYPNRPETNDRDAWFDWLNGKWCDTFAAWGPYLVTADEIPDPNELAMELRVNGEVRQTGSSRQMIFTIPETIAFLSAFMTLEPGDLIAMGTPSGVGDATGTYLKPGDVVTGTIEGLGVLTNRVVGPGA